MKRLFRPSQSWFYSLGFDFDIDFCVWTLEQDGLRVPPFDRHPDGDEALQALGLDAESWRRWFDRVAQETSGRLALPRRSSAADAYGALARVAAFDPVAVWEGEPAVGAELARLREEHEDLADQRRAQAALLERAERAPDRRLWRNLAPFRRGLPPVQIAYVGYPGVVRSVAQPAAVVLGVAGWRPTPEEFAAQILAGMAELNALRHDMS